MMLNNNNKILFNVNVALNNNICFSVFIVLSFSLSLIAVIINGIDE